MNKFFNYRFLDEDGNVIYVGRTVNLEKRINQHFSSAGHLPATAYNETFLIEYIELKSEADMFLMEIYFINKYQPKYNTKDLAKDKQTIELDFSEEWILYKSIKESKMISDLKSELSSLKAQVKAQDRVMSKLKSENKKISSWGIAVYYHKKLLGESIDTIHKIREICLYEIRMGMSENTDLPPHLIAIYEAVSSCWEIPIPELTEEELAYLKANKVKVFAGQPLDYELLGDIQATGGFMTGEGEFEWTF